MLSDPHKVSPYVYARNNPLKHTDPHGFFPKKVISFLNKIIESRVVKQSVSTVSKLLFEGVKTLRVLKLQSTDGMNREMAAKDQNVRFLPSNDSGFGRAYLKKTSQPHKAFQRGEIGVRKETFSLMDNKLLQRTKEAQKIIDACPGVTMNQSLTQDRRNLDTMSKEIHDFENPPY